VSYLEQVALGEERGALSWVIRAALWPWSVVYQVGLWLFLAVYSLRLRKRHRLGVPVISVGNLTFGGTGKTPAVEAICRMLIERGKRVAILSRGHGGSARGSVVVSDGESVLSDADEAGDEPVLLARSLPGVPVVAGRDRRVSGDLACARFAPDVIVLDDGLQYWQLHRDLDIVVMDAERPFGSGFVMPMGDLREPVSGLRRAGVVLLSNADSLDPSELLALTACVSKLAPEALVLGCSRRASSLAGADGRSVELEWLKGLDVAAFCGIGRPQSFFGMLESLGARLTAQLAFGDHYRYTRDDIARICEARAGAKAVVTTEKDFARLGPGLAIGDLYVLGIELDIEERNRLAEHIAERIDRPLEAAAAKEAAD